MCQEQKQLLHLQLRKLSLFKNEGGSGAPYGLALSFFQQNIDSLKADQLKLDMKTFCKTILIISTSGYCTPCINKDSEKTHDLGSICPEWIVRYLTSQGNSISKW